MNLGMRIGTRSKGAYRVYVQKHGEPQPLAVGRLYKEQARASKALDRHVIKHEAIYAEVRNGQRVVCVWIRGPK